MLVIYVRVGGIMKKNHDAISSALWLIGGADLIGTLKIHLYIDAGVVLGPIDPPSFEISHSALFSEIISAPASNL